MLYQNKESMKIRLKSRLIRVSFWVMKMFWNEVVYNLVSVLKTTQLYYFKRVNFLVCALYLKKHQSEPGD